MQNFSLLKRAGRAKKPVLLKRGMSATLEEFLMSAEYILAEGNYDVVPVRARRAHVLGLLAQHARPRGRAGR
jgi:3-deoxy-D-arabino-heptulosonate 7-phosphate (DAHP) synthase